MTEKLKLPPVVIWQMQALVQFHPRQMAQAAADNRFDEATKYKLTVELFEGVLQIAGAAPVKS